MTESWEQRECAQDAWRARAGAERADECERVGERGDGPDACVGDVRGDGDAGGAG